MKQIGDDDVTRTDEQKVTQCLEMLENCLRNTGSFLEPKPDGKAQTQQIRATVTWVLEELEQVHVDRRKAQLK